MANKDVVIRISATDAASPTFRKIAGDARAMGAQVEQAAATGERGMDRINKGAVAMGAAIGSATLLLGEWSRAAAQDEANQARLQQAVENTGKAYDDYSDAIDRAIKAGQEKAFSDDDTREALVRLNAVTNDTGQSLEQLSLVMDFARARGISLADSANIIAKVMGGNVSILQRYGLAIEDGATATEALALIQQRSAGQAETYANTQMGQIDKMRDRWGELTESIGASTGSLQQFLLLLPGLSAGATAIAALIGGMGGIGAISAAMLKFGGPLAVVAGGASLAYGYSQDTIGTSGTNSFWNNFFLKGSQTLNTLLPGNPYNEQKYIDQMSLNDIGDAINAIFLGPNEGQGVVWDRIASATGRITGEMSDDELRRYVQQEAAKAGLTVGAYLVNVAENSSLVRDPATGIYMEATQAARYAAIRQVQADPYAGVGQGRPMLGGDTNTAYNYALMDRVSYRDKADQTRQSYGAASVAGAPANTFARETGDSVQTSMASMGQQSVAIAENSTRALEAQYGAWIAVAGGITSTSEAMSVFNAAQNELSGEMGTYQAQASEWTGQLNAQEAAYKILEERQANGIDLTKEQTDFMNEYAHAVEVGTGAVEDSTIAAGIAAQNLLLNKEAADVFKESTGSLTESINVLIETLGGIPPTVETEIRLSTDGALGSLYEFLNLIPSSVTIPMYTTGQQVLDFMGGGAKDGTTMNAYAGGGTVYGGNHALVGERGPEVVWLPNGAQVMNTEGSKSRMNAGRRGGGDIVNYGPINLQPASTDVYGALSSQLMGGVR